MSADRVCPDCGTKLRELDVDSEKMRYYCPECAPPVVTESDVAL